MNTSRDGTAQGHVEHVGGTMFTHSSRVKNRHSLIAFPDTSRQVFIYVLVAISSKESNRISALQAMA